MKLFLKTMFSWGGLLVSAGALVYIIAAVLEWALKGETPNWIWFTAAVASPIILVPFSLSLFKSIRIDKSRRKMMGTSTDRKHGYLSKA